MDDEKPPKRESKALRECDFAGVSFPSIIQVVFQLATESDFVACELN